MSTLATPVPWTTGETITAALLNAFPNAVKAWSTTIDNTNVGAAGFFASNLIPTNATQSTFGGTSVGYSFIGPLASTVPLTVSAVGGQTADIFDVTLTSGGTKAGGFAANGTFFAGTQPATGAINGDITAAETTQIGQVFFGNGTAAQTAGIVGNANTIRIFPSNAAALTACFGASVSAALIFYASAISVVTPSTPAAAGTGDLIAQRGVSTGALNLGGSSASGIFDFGLGTVGQYSARTGAGAFPQFNGGTYNNASDASLKTNVVPLAAGLAQILALKPVSFDWIHDASPSLGFIAQDVQPIFPQLVSASGDGILGVNYDGIIPVLVKAVQEMQGLLHAAGVAGF